MARMVQAPRHPSSSTAGHGLIPGLTATVLIQGMNFVAGYLILITKNEEEAFWLLDALVGRILPGMWEAQPGSLVGLS